MKYAKIAIVISLLTWAAMAAGQGTCSTELLQGTYAVEHTGLVYMGVNAPYSLLGAIAADRDGTVHSHWVQVSPFGFLEYDQFGYWTVTPDCKVTLTNINEQKQPSGTSEGLAVHNGDEIRMMITAPLIRAVPPPNGPQYPSVGSGILRRMTPGTSERCSVATLRGTYAQTCSGYFKIAGPPMTFLPTRGSLTVNVNGDGTGTGSGKLVFGGEVHPGEYVDLTYNTVNTATPGCWVAATFKINDEPGIWTEKMLIFDNGKEMLSTTTSSPFGSVDICRFTRLDH